MADSKDILICPACGEKMEKFSISNKAFQIDVCTKGCGGIYFDNRELEHFDEKHENADEIIEILNNCTINKTINDTEKRVCPNCSAIMVKNGTLKNTCSIDVCYCCGGKFLDHGEFEKIRTDYDTEKERKEAYNNLFTKEFISYQNKNRW